MKKLTIFSVKNRIESLVIFLQLSREYFNSLNVSSFGGSSETNASLAIRSQLNGMIGKIEQYVHDSDATDIYHYRAAPVAGGYQQNVRLIQNIFALHQYQISPLILFDTLERAISDYRDDIPQAWFRTFNPFYWISVFIHKLIVFPFILLSNSGFDGQRIQNSYIGKSIMLILNVVLSLIAALSGIATILGAVNKLDWAVSLINKL